MTESTAFDPDDWRAKSPDFTGETFRRAVQVAIVGARRPSQLDGTAPAADIELSGAGLKEIDTILTDAVPAWGPHPEGMGEEQPRWQSSPSSAWG